MSKQKYRKNYEKIGENRVMRENKENKKIAEKIRMSV